MGLDSDIARAPQITVLDAATMIQVEAIPPIRAGRDVPARSQTGIGKTLAFAIPAIESIETDGKSPTVQLYSRGFVSTALSGRRSARPLCRISGAAERRPHLDRYRRARNRCERH